MIPTRSSRQARIGAVRIASRRALALAVSTLLTLSLLALPVFTAARAAPAPGSVRGRVVEAGKPGAGVAGARVIASDPASDVADTVFADAEGRFIARNLSPGKAVLMAQARGFAQSWTRCTVAVRSGAELSGAVLTLARTATLTGRVVEANGSPVARAKVEAVGARTRTGADGRYTLTGVSPELVSVSAQSPVHVAAQSPPLHLQPGETRALADLVLRRGRSIRGRVLATDGKPIAGARLNATGRGTLSDAHGNFTLGGLEPGGELYAWKDGYEGASLPLPSDTLDLDHLTLKLARATGLESPSPLMISLQRDTWMPGEAVRLDVNASASTPISVRVQDAKGRVVQHLAAAPSRPKHNTLRPVEIRGLPAGEYTCTATLGTGRNIALKSLAFRVSPIALVVERWPGGDRVRAVSMQDGAPVAGLALEDEAQGGSRPLGSTDAAGLVPLPDPGSPTHVVRSADPARPARVEVVSGDLRESPARIAVLTDRPALRPGGALGFKVIARQEAAAGLEPIVDSTVLVTVWVPGAEPATRTGRLDAEGVYVDSLRLPGEVTMGEAGLGVQVAEASAHRSMPLTRRPTPAFRVRVTPDRAIALPGDSVRFLVHVAREDGLPASSIWIDIAEHEAPSSYDWGPDLGQSGYDWLGLARREHCLTDAQGDAVFAEGIPELAAGDIELVVEATAQEPGSEAVMSDASVHALAASRHVSVATLDPARAGQPFAMNMRVQDLPRRAAAGARVRADLYRMRTERNSRRSQWLEGADLVAGSDGMVSWNSASRAEAGGNYRVRLLAPDSLGRVSVAECYLWTPGGSAAAPAELAFQLVATRDTIDEGASEARFRILAGRPGVAHVAAAGIDEFRWLPDVTFPAGTTEFSVPASEFGAAGVRVAAYAAWQGEPREAQAVTVLNRPGSRLAVSLTPSVPVASPRDTVRVHVETRDAAGRGVPAEVHLTAYDRGLLAFGPDANPDLHEQFWLPRPIRLQLVPSVSRFERAGGKDQAPTVRRDFRDVSFWAPRLRTGADGTADVSLVLPDNLTTWRITAHAVGAHTAVGRAAAEVTARQRVALALTSPEALVAGDSVVFRATLREAAGEPAREFRDWRVQVQGGRLAGGVPAVTVSPQSPAAVDLPVVVGADSDSLRLVVSAQSGGLGDGLERVYPVERRARAVLSVSGLAQGQGVQWDSTVVYRWNSPALAALEQAGWLSPAPPADAGPERVAYLAARDNLRRLGYADLVMGFAWSDPPREADDEGDAAAEDAVPGEVPHRNLQDVKIPVDLNAERLAMFQSLAGPGALLRADGSLDVARASDVIAAACAGQDTISIAAARPLRELGRRMEIALAAPRLAASDRAAARRAVELLRHRFGRGRGMPAGDEVDARIATLLREGNFEAPIESSDLWCFADRALRGMPTDGVASGEMWMALAAERGRGWPGIWPQVAASHLRTSDVAFVAAHGRGMNEAAAIQWLTRAERLGALPAPAPEPAVERESRQGHAPADAPADTSHGALYTTFYRSIPSTDAWGEPAFNREEVRGPLRAGETLRMVVRSTRAVECGDLRVRVPLCGALDERPPVGAEGAEGRPLWTSDARQRGRIESQVWRPSCTDAVVWEADVRVTHAGRFTLLPPVMSSRAFPGLSLAGETRTLEVLP